MQRGRFGHRPRNDARYYNGIYPFIQTGNIVNASVSNERIQYTQTLNELGLSTSRLFDEKVLVITIAANIGYTAILDYPACFPDSLVALKPKDSDLTLEYLNIYIRFIRQYIENLAPQAAQRNINLKQLGKLPIIIPNRNVQQEVVSIMEVAYSEKMKKEKEAQILLESIDTYLLQELGINLPSQEENTLESRMFYVSADKTLGNRLDPRKYTQKYQHLFSAIENAPFPRKCLRDLLVDSVSGNWGKDDSVADENLVSSLAIRATEFDNKYNLNLDNKRMKFRKYDAMIYEKIKLTPNDILIEKSGGSDNQPVGRVAFIEKEMVETRSLAYSNFIHKIVINETEAVPRYVYEYLRLIHNIKITEVMQTQTNGIKNLIMGEYFNLTIILPEKEKQLTIAREASRKRRQALEIEMKASQILEAARIQVKKILLGDSL
ncbi:MAG: restriction endonuclease [Butyrivibrio sp.]|nr:restriction endonuclease [Butyrivibrio sp.]